MKSIRILEFNIYPSFHLNVDIFIDTFLSVYEIFRPWVGEKLIIHGHDKQSTLRTSVYSEQDKENIKKTFHIMREHDGSECILIESDQKRNGQPVSAAFGCLLGYREEDYFRYSIWTRFDAFMLKEFKYDKIINFFVFLSLSFRSYYGYAKTCFRDTDTWNNNHYPHEGPCRLEWLNWFADCYMEIFQKSGKCYVPFEKHLVGREKYHLLRMCERPEDFQLRKIRRLVETYKKVLGPECFSRKMDKEWQKALYMWFNIDFEKNAELIPNYKNW